MLDPFNLDTTQMSKKGWKKFPENKIGQGTHGIPFGGTSMGGEGNMGFRSHVTMAEILKRLFCLAYRKIEIALGKLTDIVSSKSMTIRLLGI